MVRGGSALACRVVPFGYMHTEGLGSLIEAEKLTDEALLAYDDMMMEVAVKIEKLAPLAIRIGQQS